MSEKVSTAGKLSGEAAHGAVEQNSSLREDLLRVLYQALSGSGMHL